MGDSSWRDRLRGLPVFAPGGPEFDPDTAPDDPRALFEEWLDAAISAGLPAPHAATLSTSDAAARVNARTLNLKDVDERGWWFASRTDGVKARELSENPQAALTFFWREHARQVRVRGAVVDAGRDAATADHAARPVHSRAAAAIGRQSAPLGSRAEYVDAFASAKADLAKHPDRGSDTWAAFILEPTEVEFWASTPTDGQIRLAYRRTASGEPWTRGLLWP